MKKTFLNGINRKSILFYSIILCSMMFVMTSKTYADVPQPPCLPDCPESNWINSSIQIQLNKPGCNSCDVTIDYWYRYALCKMEYDFQITGLSLSDNCIRCMDPDFNIMSLYGWAVQKLTKHLWVNVWQFPEDTCVTNWRMSIITCWTKWTAYHYINTHMPREQWVSIDSFIYVNPCPITQIVCCFKKLLVCHTSSNDSVGINFLETNFGYPGTPTCELNTNGYDCHWMCNFELEPPFFENGEEPPLKTSSDFVKPKQLRMIMHSGNITIQQDSDRKGDFTIDIYDLKGALLHKQKGNVLNDTKINLQNLTAGSYFYRILYEDGFYKSAVFLIE